MPRAHSKDIQHGHLHSMPRPSRSCSLVPLFVLLVACHFRSTIAQYDDHEYILIMSGKCTDQNQGLAIPTAGECDHALAILANAGADIRDTDSYNTFSSSKPPGCVPQTAGSSHYTWFNTKGNSEFTCGTSKRCVCIYEPLCLVNQHVSNGACLNCAAGKTNAKGDNTKSGDTDCDPILCTANQHVQSHACVTCASGLVREAGDDASGDDTACAVPCQDTSGWDDLYSYTCSDYRSNLWCAGNAVVHNGYRNYGAEQNCCGCGKGIVVCLSNEHVVDHVCTPCPVGTSHPAGDAPSG
jgi:hypothetical protein